MQATAAGNGSARLAARQRPLAPRLPILRRPAPAAAQRSSPAGRPHLPLAPRPPQPEPAQPSQPAQRPTVACEAGGAAVSPPASTRAALKSESDPSQRADVRCHNAGSRRRDRCESPPWRPRTGSAPVMVADPKLGMDITQIGAMTSIFPIAYGMSKFVSGVLGARFSPSVLLAGGLMATALVNIAFGFGSSLAWFCFFWALNGTLQGVGGPCCARILTTWFASKERGTYWGMWNIAHNLGGFAAPLVAGGFAKAMGWKWGMWAPGIIGLVVGTFVLFTCRDKPEDVGFPPVEPVAAKKADAKKPDVLKQLVNTVLKNPFIWGMALTYFFIYVVRQGVTSWFVFYLIKEKGVADAAEAAVRVSGLELGGLFGSLLAGRLSDMLIARSGGKGGNVGKRVQVRVGGRASDRTRQQHSIALWIAYLGAANAGIPLSIIVKEYGWGTYFSTLVGACALALLLLAPMTNLRSYVQRKEQRRLRKGL
ncbi:hypothetical protein Rsub_11020 [Raphidocelis subcapitata]|uniref:Major facilitator superfamily (MFS) profile domain-containing protein n=1 Tax=Raphidocelis subcapitata TaxID=307507 RepID=A0A2V0PHH7_9CHLO|nr:hypothetical protein Rsub_11020 [Raphidocelis subcapitata]|eukprot:GBF97373.1 hypothetical protein Rsub_11020 [Raphidocelis subcapitata]